MLRPPPLPMKLAGALFLFGTSVPPASKELASELQEMAQRTLRSDPRVSMELGMGIEAGGIYASAANDRGLAINFQINGGNSWAECTAFGVVGDDGLELVDLTVANMDAAMLGQVSLEIAPSWMAGQPSPTNEGASLAQAMAAARSQAINGSTRGRVVPTALGSAPSPDAPNARTGEPRMSLVGRSRRAAAMPHITLGTTARAAATRRPELVLLRGARRSAPPAMKGVDDGRQGLGAATKAATGLLGLAVILGVGGAALAAFAALAALVMIPLGLIPLAFAPGAFDATAAVEPLLSPAPELLSSTAAHSLLPAGGGVHLETTVSTLLADESGKWFSADFDSLAAAAIPFILAGLLFVLFKLAKLFASAF